MNCEGANDDEQLGAIQSLCAGDVTRRIDGWRQLIHMKGLRFMAAGQSREMDAILVLNHDNETYPTKLYLKDNVGCGLNWNETAFILGENWHTYSWANVPRDLPPVEILANHLAAIPIKEAA